MSLWPRCGFASPDEAARAYERGYPHAPHDEYLVDYIGRIAEDAQRP